ncbi:Tc toxin subunit A [Pseudomonas lundensis]|uniref:Tc toxin subunit A n=1 Tax=Pseudomonas lundensis TaxID=86185 RepID=UPI00385BCA51
MLASERPADSLHGVLEFIDMSQIIALALNNSPTDLVLSLAAIADSSMSGMENFNKKMVDAQLFSVFDIARVSKKEFCNILTEFTAEEMAGKIYDQALSYAVQLEILHRQQNDSLTEDQRVKRQMSAQSAKGATYCSLFPQESNQVCAPQSLAAMDSPVAYLRALYLFALQLEKTGTGNQTKKTLSTRRASLENLKIDANAVYAQTPLLNIINELLHEGITKALRDNKDIYSNATVEYVLKTHCYPLQLPFYLPYEQCVSALGAHHLKLGELNYKISLALPVTQQPSTAYGKVQQESYEAQRLLAHLGPHQQVLITDNKDLGATAKEKDAFAKKVLGSTYESLKTPSWFMERTDLNDEHMQALFSLGKYLPVQSTQLPGKQSDVHAELKLPTIKKEGNVATLDFDKPEQLDLAQRIIRLQRWMKCSFNDVKHFVYSVKQADLENDKVMLNDNTLRALGVYRYLEKHYTLSIEEFSALLHHLPVHQSGTTRSLYDRVYNRKEAFNVSFKLDGSAFTPDSQDDASLEVVYLICASLGVPNTRDAFGVMAAQLHKYGPETKKDVATFSAFYRQVRIARLFNLSLAEMYQLAELLGGKDYSKQLVTPSLRMSGSNTPPDFLDVLMQMEWAVQWFNSAAIRLSTIRRQLLLDDMDPDGELQEKLSTFEKLLAETERYVLVDADFSQLTTQGALQLELLKFTKGHVLIKTILKVHPLLPETPDLPKLNSALKKLVKAYISPSALEKIQDETVLEMASLLAPYLDTAYKRLLPWKAALLDVFPQGGTAAEPASVQEKRIKHIVHGITVALGNQDSRRLLKNNMLAVPNAAASLKLPISQAALQTFINHPHWLDSRSLPEGFLKLSLNTLYLMTQFQLMLVAYRVSEASLFNYLAQVNRVESLNDDQMAMLLGRLLGWDAGEIKVLLENVPFTRVKSIAQLDWVVRCHQTSHKTGLPASLILAATNLNSDISGPQWKQVGEALIAASV